MSLQKFAQELQDQCEELSMLRRENLLLRKELAKYQEHVSDELQFWNNTYANILNKLAGEEYK